MIDYEYPDKTTEPDLQKIHEDVSSSEMTDKNIKYCSWNEDDTILHVFWLDELSGEDKAILDNIVEEN